MRIGMLADIHDAVELLRCALARLEERGVDRVVTLGDAFESWGPAEPGVEVAGLLQEAGAIGVWGNHDAGLSLDAGDDVTSTAAPGLLEFAGGLLPQLVLEGCRFSHIEPWRDPRRVEDLWAFDGAPDSAARAERSFRAVRERIMFVGHFHRWLAVRRWTGTLAWNGSTPVTLAEPDRYLVAIAAVVDGWCAVFDTDESELTPIRCSN